MGIALIVTSAATLFGSAPFILAAALLARMPLRRSSWLVPYLGCGCGAGPSARSLPAAAAAWWVFGPFVAIGRLAAAIAVDRFLLRNARCEHAESDALVQLCAILPLAAAGAGVALFAPALFGSHPRPFFAFAGAAAAAFAFAPCGIGTIAIAGSLRGVMPLATAGLLCVAGVFDQRTWLRTKRCAQAHDTFAYAITALACALAAAHGGAGLVHPALARSLWLCAACCAAFAVRYRERSNARLRIAPAIMLCGALVTAPPPVYHATETTLGDAFAGERIDFTGSVTQSSAATALVRYAITCCRADAAPVVIALAHAQPDLRGWVHARGTLIQTRDGLRLQTSRLQPIAPPRDPFVYR